MQQHKSVIYYCMMLVYVGRYIFLLIGQNEERSTIKKVIIEKHMKRVVISSLYIYF